MMEKMLSIEYTDFERVNHYLEEGWSVKMITPLTVCGEQHTDGRALVVLQK